MNKRERILVIVIGVLAVAFVARVVVKKYLTALEDARSSVVRASDDLKEAKEAKEAYEAHRAYWEEVGEQTLTQDAQTIGNTLREDLLEIAREAGLQQIEVDPGQARPPTERRPIGTAYPKVSAWGRMENVIKFVHDVQTQPYLVRFRKLTLSPDEDKDRQTGKRTTSGMLELKCDLETPILFSGKGFPKFKPDPDNEKGPLRLAHKEVDPYVQQISPKMFMVWVPPPEKATVIDPPNNGQPFEGQIILKWRPGARATKHIVHYGAENPPPVVTEIPANPQQPAAEYRIPEKLAAGETRYWRIDEEGEGGVTEGDVFSFTTRAQPAPGKAMVILPSNNGETLEGRVALRWRPGAHATQHEVYWWKEGEEPKKVASQAGAEYTIPEELEAGLTLHWRIDEVGPGGTTEGDVWTFRTTPKPPPPQQIAHADMMVGRILSWPGSQQVVLEKPGSKNLDDDLRVEVGDPLYKGILVMVHSEGVVSAEDLSDGQTRFYFHQIGTTVAQAQPLSAETHPRIYREVQQLQRTAEGITQGPG